MNSIRAYRCVLWAFVALLWVGQGCHISNYGPILDNNQTSTGGGPREIRDTRGKAKLVAASQWAYLIAGETIETMNFVRQDASGAQTLTTHNNHSISGEATFLDDLYCSPEIDACTAFRSIDPDPSVNDPAVDDPFDGRFFGECPRAYASAILSTGRYYGECGRTGPLSLRDRLALFNMGRLGTWQGMEALQFDLNRDTFSIYLDNNAGVVTPLPIAGETEVWLRVGGSRSVFDARNPLQSRMLLSYAGWLEQHGERETTLTACYNGICRDWSLRGAANDDDEYDLIRGVLQIANRY